jgi:hypothetical protein
MKNTYETPLSADLISTVKSIVEQPLDELSKNTLISYNKKAGPEASRTWGKIWKKAAKYDPATEKVGTTEDERWDAIHADPDLKKYRNRQAGLKLSKAKVKAKDKAWLAHAKQTRTNEEAEINELSKATLGRYIKAASSSLIPSQRTQDRQFNAARDYSYTDPESSKYHADKGVKTGKKIQNRRDGIDKATDKLTKESKED